MIKHPEKYQDFQDPQAHPRYTGIATFFRHHLLSPFDDDDLSLAEEFVDRARSDASAVTGFVVIAIISARWMSPLWTLMCITGF